MMNALLRPLDICLERPSRQTAAARARFLSQQAVSLVLDVGAHRGEYARSLRRNGYTGIIHSFEPLPGAFSALERAASRDPLWFCHCIAVGAVSGTTSFYVSPNETSSSLLPMLPRHEQGAPGTSTSDQISVAVRRLDDLDLDIDRHCCAIKLDVQGAEALVLRGSTSVLPRVRLIEIEMSIVELYEGQPLLVEQLSSLEDMGFRMIWLERGFRDQRTGELLQIDGSFSRV